ncbi:MAG: hypothetical protein ACRDM1_08485 [Gaiellaceae bacterium]
MTLSAPTQTNPPLRYHREAARRTSPEGALIRFSPRRAADHVQHILMVEFTSSEGRAWQAIGGGDTLADAIAFARDSCPTDTTWQPVGWDDLYGD